MGEEVLLRMTGISKAFPGVQALDDVHLDVEAGTVHALMGENGAGKSTLMKVLAGIYRADTGTHRAGRARRSASRTVRRRSASGSR